MSFFDSGKKAKRVGNFQSMPYSAYTKSWYWKIKRDNAISRADGRCQVCYKDDGNNLHVCHRTHERIGNERKTDMIVLCDSCYQKLRNDIGKYSNKAQEETHALDTVSPQTHKSKTSPGMFSRDWYLNVYLISDEWKTIRLRILKRDKKRCLLCGQAAGVVHHRTYSQEILDGNDDSQLASLCRKCHEEVHFDSKGNRRISHEEEFQKRLEARKSS